MLYLNIIWHMHQPCYVDFRDNSVLFPWVWAHVIHDYYEMPWILRRYPDVKVTFNLVPSLLKQIDLYRDGKIKDFFWTFIRNFPDFEEKDRDTFVKLCFSMDEERMIKPYRGFYAMKRKYSEGIGLSDEEMFDAGIWFVIAWMPYRIRSGDKHVVEMMNRGRGFKPEDASYLEGLVMQMLSEVIGLYKELEYSSQVEISTTPFYHPILPLIIDTDVASKCMPDAPLPYPAFSYRQDAAAHVKNAIEYYNSVFGKLPLGMWPAEGGVSEAAISLMGEHGIRWIATDEDILKKTLSDRGFDRNDIYKPYRFGDVAIFFRDKILSDLIGFTYSGWDSPEDAARDFVARLNDLDGQLRGDNAVVTVALDGENPWEYYSDGGERFLNALYAELSSSKDVHTILPSEYISSYGCPDVLNSVYPGSWIDANFSTWIGEDEKNRAWRLLRSTRQFLEESLKPVPEEVWRCIYIAEGSDWFWWFGGTHFTLWHREFDELFRSNLISVYESVGHEPPPELFLPVKLTVSEFVKKPVSFVYPKINGRIDGYIEWLGAGEFNVRNELSSMSFGYKFVTNVFLGFNENKFFLMLSGAVPYDGMEPDVSIKIYLMVRDRSYLLPFALREGTRSQPLYICNNGCIDGVGEVDVSVCKVVELGFDWTTIDAKSGDKLEVVVVVLDKMGRVLERVPRSGTIAIDVPDEEFEERNWFV
ncbi:MAG: hypothetical protein J7L41_02880 [Synergistetes bacterium]|nr:hypothetical protein [Synergistota bacterium]